MKKSVLSTYKRLTDEEKLAIRKDKLKQFLPDAMRKHQIDCWIVLTREYVQDPIAEDLAAGGPTARAAMIFTDEGERVWALGIFASYDVDTPTRSGIYDQIISYGSEGLKPHLENFFKMRKPKKIAVNISKDAPLADGLTAGMLDYLMQAAGSSYDRSDFVSAEPVIVEWRGKKTSREIEILRVAVKATEEIIAETFSPAVIQPGKTTELDLANFVKEKLKKMNVTEAWEPDGCPSINTGVSRGHSSPGKAVIQPGHLLTIDFGIKLDGYCTDIQRTAYILQPGEKQPPDNIQKMWKTNVKAVELGFAAMQPKNTGNDVDRIARKTITDAGYQEYQHGTGHPIGYITHEVGPLLGPNWPERYGDKVFLRLEPNQVFALEPAVFVDSKELGGQMRIGIEEDVLITEKGPEWLSTPQKQLILIPSE
ncbi:MAG TPA: Xaa-Pro peptidase family protein [Acidobacteriota bacterium]|nr:Xaa-Pro peptidase family protein [Acidobacteriota bacterium]